MIASDVETQKNVTVMQERIKKMIPELRCDSQKGEAGRLGIVGGSTENSGAAYFAAIAALKVGADLAHVFCTKDDAPVIESYSPALIIHPWLDSDDAIERIKTWLEPLHVLVIGPGLGKDSQTLKTVTQLIEMCRNIKKPVVIDGDVLHLLTQDLDIIKGYEGAILTPNASEFAQIFGESQITQIKIMRLLDRGVTVLKKDYKDNIFSITNVGSEIIIVDTVPAGGSGRRSGGQGDLLAGACAVFWHWAIMAGDERPRQVACFAACQLIKKCNELAFEENGRNMITTDMVGKIHRAFKACFE